MIETRTLYSLAGEVDVYIRNPRQQQKRHWMQGRFYEQDMLHYIWRNYDGGVFVDCGACIGNHTLFFAAFCADYVVAVEPDIANHRHILDNVVLNQLQQRVAVINVALSDQSGRCALIRFGEDEGMQKIDRAGDDIVMSTLDEIMVNLDGRPVTLIKIDVEWHELHVVRGAIDTIARWRPAIFAELNTEAEQRAMQMELAPFGYRMGRRFNASPTFEFKAD